MDTSPIRFRAGRYANLYLVIILFIAVFGLGIMVGQAIAAKKTIKVADATNIDKVLNLYTTNLAEKNSSVDFNQFWQVWEEIKKSYVKQPVKDSDLFYGAIQGMVYALGDPHSLYFPPKAAEEVVKSMSGEFEGIGAEIGIKNNQLVVVSPLPGTPAAKAGLRPGDQIILINGTSTVGLDTSSAVEQIRGKANTTVVLNIMRAGWEKPQDISIVRRKINIPSVTFEDKGNGVAYMRVMQFNDTTMDQFNQAIKQIQKKKLNKIILDLRGNPGGYLDMAVAMGSEWVKDGVIVTEKYSNGESNVNYTEGTHRLAGIPTVVLVNGGSASAAEIVAGALQDYKFATIIGEKTYGKGSVQNYEPFSDGSALKLTIAEWFTPNDKNINEQGIKPDIEVKEEWEKEAVGQDIMIDKAVELLKTPQN